MSWAGPAQSGVQEPQGQGEGFPSTGWEVDPELRLHMQERQAGDPEAPVRAGLNSEP